MGSTSHLNKTVIEITSISRSNNLQIKLDSIIPADHTS